MANKNGLLESMFAQGLKDASKTDVLIVGGYRPDAMPDDAPRTEAEVIQRCLEAYREDQALIDAAYRGAADFLSTPEGMARIKALNDSWTNGEPTDFGRSLAEGIYTGDSFAAMNAELKNRDVAAFGLGGAGSFVPLYFGGAGGAEHLFLSDAVNHRYWADGEIQFISAVTLGLSLSIWKYTPLTGLMFGLAFEFPYPAFPAFVTRFMMIGQREQATKKFKFFGAEMQLGIGAVAPPVAAGGIFIGYQWAKKRTRRVELSVINQATGNNTFIVDTETSLDVTITAVADLSFDKDAIIKLNMPNYFTSANIMAMTFSGIPSYLTQTLDSKYNIILTFKQDYTLYAAQTIKFTIGSVESAGDENQDRTKQGLVTLTGNPTTKIPIATTADLYLATSSYCANISWTATPGNGLTLGDPCASATTSNPCTGEMDDECATGGNTPTAVVPATDSDGNTWELGYQFNYTDGTAHIRAVIYDPDKSAALITNWGTWVQYPTNGSSKATYGNTNGNVTFQVDVTFL